MEQPEKYYKWGINKGIRSRDIVQGEKKDNEQNNRLMDG